MEFEFDPMKSVANKSKHGIDFEAAKSLWADPYLLEVPALSDDELRSLVIGRIGEKHWSAIITYRNGNIRLISVRRARKEEVERYEGP
ncbi:MAG: BrnT family toxin [Rhodospirillaceae bacterium]